MPESASQFQCPVCTGPVSVGLTRKRNGLWFRCIANGKHYRGFIMDPEYVAGVLGRLSAPGE